MEQGKAFVEIQVAIRAVLFTALTAWLCYDAVWGMLWGIVLYPLCRRSYIKKQRQVREYQMAEEFKELLLVLSTYLRAGYSLENAFLQAREELYQLAGKESLLLPAVGAMNQKVQVNVPVEQACMELAGEMQLEEGFEFAEILLFAKRLGGNYNKNIQRTAAKLQEKMEIYQEIETMTAEKHLEMKVMIAMPVLILVYIKMSSGDFLESLYHNAAGIGIMTGCLLLYLLMIYLGKRIIQITV